MAKVAADTSLRRLSRRDLLELLVQMSEENDRLKARVTELESQLASKELRVSEAGSLAQAAAEVSELLLAAQRTADLYLHNLPHTHEVERKAPDRIYEDGAACEDVPPPEVSVAPDASADKGPAHRPRHMAGSDAS